MRGGEKIHSVDSFCLHHVILTQVGLRIYHISKKLLNYPIGFVRLARRIGFAGIACPSVCVSHPATCDVV